MLSAATPAAAACGAPSPQSMISTATPEATRAIAPRTVTRSRSRVADPTSSAKPLSMHPRSQERPRVDDRATRPGPNVFLRSCLFVVGHHAVSDARLGHDEVAQRPGRVGGRELAPHLADVHVHVARLALVRLPPDRAQDAALGDQASPVGQQHAKDLELAWREVHRPGGHGDAVAERIEDERTRGEATTGTRRRTRGMTQRDTEACAELGHAHWLRDVVIRTL